MEKELLSAISRGSVSGKYTLGMSGDRLMDHDFAEVLFEDCIIEGGDFASSSFSDCTFRRVEFVEVSLMAVTFVNCDLEQVGFSHCDGSYSFSARK